MLLLMPAIAPLRLPWIFAASNKLSGRRRREQTHKGGASCHN